MQESKIGYIFIVLASIVIVFAGIKSASEIIVPFLLSLFLAIILAPLYNFFRNKKLSESLSILLVITLFLVIIFLVMSLIGSSAREFSSKIDFYVQQLTAYQLQLLDLSAQYGIELPKEEFVSMVDTKYIMNFARTIFDSLASVFTNGFVIVLTVIFMILEGTHFTQKLHVSDSKKQTVQQVKEIFSKIKEYMVLKAIISLITALVIWVSLFFIGTDYAFLWAFLAFLLNFIPNIGSIIAAVPAVLLTIIQLGSFSAILVAILYTTINVVIGSIIEPKIMGKGLGLSTLVVFLSLLFWGWLLGPIGMLLSVPLTIMAKIILDSNQSTQWIATLLGDGSNLTSKEK
ncbi:MAG: AI-2E family transporter [Helicobacteraceae bacterium]|nr:AI-2E family transporter [Helicobacteraceae bacterium]